MELLSQSAASGRFQVEERTNERTKASQTVVVVVVVLEGAVRHRGSRRSVAVFVAVAVAAAVGLARLARRTQSYNQMHCTQTNYHCRLPPAALLLLLRLQARRRGRRSHVQSSVGRSASPASARQTSLFLSGIVISRIRKRATAHSHARLAGRPPARLATSYLLSATSAIQILTDRRAAKRRYPRSPPFPLPAGRPPSTSAFETEREKPFSIRLRGREEERTRCRVPARLAACPRPAGLHRRRPVRRRGERERERATTFPFPTYLQVLSLSRCRTATRGAGGRWLN